MSVSRKVKPGSPVVVSRRTPDFLWSIAEPYAHRLGEVVWVWNTLQASLCYAFIAMIGNDRAGIAAAIWHSHKSDKSQREMLVAAAEEALRTRPWILARIKWICRQVDYLSGRRNDFVHSPMAIWKRGPRLEVVPDILATLPKRAERLATGKLDKLMRDLWGDLHALATYALVVGIEMNAPGSIPSSSLRKPRLRLPPPNEQRARMPRRRRYRKRHRIISRDA